MLSPLLGPVCHTAKHPFLWKGWVGSCLVEAQQCRKQHNGDFYCRSGESSAPPCFVKMDNTWMTCNMFIFSYWSGDQSKLTSNYKKKKKKALAALFFSILPCLSEVLGSNVQEKTHHGHEEGLGRCFQPTSSPAFSQKQSFTGYRQKCWQKVGAESVSTLQVEFLERRGALGSIPRWPLLEEEGRQETGTRKLSLSLNTTVI